MCGNDRQKRYIRCVVTGINSGMDAERETGAAQRRATRLHSSAAAELIGFREPSFVVMLKDL